MFGTTDQGMSHCIERTWDRILPKGSSDDDAEQLLWNVLRILNSSIPDDWALTRNSPHFIVRVMKSNKHNMSSDMLVLGTTLRPAKNHGNRLYHLINTVFEPNMISTEGRRGLRGVLGTYVPEEFGRALANRPNVYVWLDDHASGPYAVWVRDEVYAPLRKASDFHSAFAGSKDWETAAKGLFEVHSLRPITAMGLAKDTEKLVRLSYDGSVSALRVLPPGFVPEYYGSFAPMKAKELSEVRVYEDLMLEQIASDNVEIERKYDASVSLIEKCNSLLTSRWQSNAGLTLPGSKWTVGTPDKKSRPYRYFDTPTLMFRNRGGSIRVRERNGDIVFSLKMPISAISSHRFEWDSNVPSVTSLSEIDAQHIRDMLSSCVADPTAMADDQLGPGLSAMLADSNLPLIEVLQLNVDLTVWELQNTNGGGALVSLDRVTVLSEGQTATSFCEIEVECGENCSEKDWKCLCEFLQRELNLQELQQSSKYERALSLLANK